MLVGVSGVLSPEFVVDEQARVPSTRVAEMKYFIMVSVFFRSHKESDFLAIKIPGRPLKAKR
jgi:hypothetical protein